MSTNSFELLARALDALPGGFPRTTSGVEISLLQKAFKPEEAELAGQMTRKYEKVDELANRIGKPLDLVQKLLNDLQPRELVRRKFVDNREHYRLGPFIIGWYEALMEGQMRNDLEFASLFEQYMKEGGGERIMSPRPGILGVVPVRGSLKPELLQPHDDINAHFARHERFGVSDCMCRLQQNLLGSHCTKPVKRCGFVGLPPQTPISDHVLDREQALTLFKQLEDEGHVHTGFYGFIKGAETPQFVGCCNCCGDCCGILRAVNEWGAKEGPQKSNYRAVVNVDNCILCGECITRCQVHAIIQTENGVPNIIREQCIGCGLCVVKCSGDAIELVPVSTDEWFDVPSSFEEWEERRLAQIKQEQSNTDKNNH